MNSNKRLVSLDVLRGMTVAGMILVNNGSGDSFEMLQHSAWNGLTPCDLVFPFFLFIMGISCYLSLSKTQFVPTAPIIYKVVRRSVLLFVIGLLINWFGNAVWGDPFDFAHLRYFAVLQRIALCYFFVSMFALFVNHRYTIPTIVLLLCGYGILLTVGDGYAEDARVNILGRTDLLLFGYDHLYHHTPIDPEGLLGTISGVAHVLIGFYCGKLIKTAGSIERKMIGLFAVGIVCVMTGYLLSYGLPLNKCVWSPSYALVTCGLAASLQALAMLVVDYRSCNPLYYKGFQIFGMNALILYVGSELLAIVFGRWGVSSFIYEVLHTVISSLKWCSLAYALTFVAINFVIGYVLYRKRIFIKL
ncbi:MAG: DUF1624 domain-containing protein [Paludibacteraceae bacterium]|nr:DUF1624 domain-containing protein [Paludibacteraceae bacterium]MBQ8714451.1 DUF1624 domain-containing protein [Prevotella sp.]